MCLTNNWNKVVVGFELPARDRSAPSDVSGADQAAARGTFSHVAWKRERGVCAYTREHQFRDTVGLAPSGSCSCSRRRGAPDRHSISADNSHLCQIIKIATPVAVCRALRRNLWLMHP